MDEVEDCDLACFVLRLLFVKAFGDGVLGEVLDEDGALVDAGQLGVLFVGVARLVFLDFVLVGDCFVRLLGILVQQRDVVLAGPLDHLEHVLHLVVVAAGGQRGAGELEAAAVGAFGGRVW